MLPILRSEISVLIGDPVESLELVHDGVRALSYLVNGRWHAKRFAERTTFSDQEITSYRLLADSHITPSLVAADFETPLLVTDYVKGVGLFEAFDRVNELGALMASLIVSTATIDDAPRIRTDEAQKLRASYPSILAFTRSFGVEQTPSIEAVVEHYVSPPMLTLTQGDPAPSNVIFLEDRALLVDFEYAAVRHALFDLAQWYVRCPLPLSCQSALQNAAREVYQGEFERDLATMQVYAGLYMLSWLPLDGIRGHNRPWAEGWTVREALISTAQRSAQAAKRAGLGELQGWFERLADVCRRMWPALGEGSIRPFLESP